MERQKTCLNPASILIHLIFSTKHREPFITSTIETELHPDMAKIFRELQSPSLTIDGTSDHIHVLFALGRVITIADLVEEVKTESSKWIKTKGSEFRNFHWQKGYGAFSIGQSQVPAVKHYIGRQKQHHRRVTFQDEYRKFLKAYGIDYDERIRLGLSISRLQRSITVSVFFTWAVGPGFCISRLWRVIERCQRGLQGL